MMQIVPYMVKTLLASPVMVNTPSLRTHVIGKQSHTAGGQLVQHTGHVPREA